ncbi:helix-turn-helix domain-containing protein [Streptomyces sp. LRE541]|uniref:helix-turn-helix domain-containing protein n=1 Tax=Streptomyces sp. LRE541 TaxID=2931983 RepID=UPI00201072D0|nr:helix-turn-helix domain-containing protein [Streptomyces sp. LRE541]UPZ27286.1 helix-turn-helix domain-containing protein [Streptomyces sp. LRE541]
MTPTHARAMGPQDAVPLPRETRRLLLRHLPAAIDEMEEAVRTGLPHYTHAVEGTHGYSVRHIIDRTVSCFVSIHDATRAGQAATAEVIALYERIGARHGLLGCPLDVLRDALDLAGRVACRRLIEDAYRLHWPAPLLATLTEDTFTLIGTAIAAASRGYAEECHRAPLDVQRDRLRDALVADPGERTRPLAELAAAADWRLPGTVAVLALPPGDHPQTRVLPPEVLADRRPAAPYLVLPDPRTPGPRWLPRTIGAVLGPAVPPGRGAVSLRWARRGLQLVQRGLLPAAAPLRCVDHLAALTAFRSGDLLEAAAADLLGPLLELAPRRREPLLETLLVYLRCGDNAVLTADRLHVHEQTVRYRLRQITQLTDGACPDPERHLETMLVLTWLLSPSTANAPTAGTAGPPPQAARPRRA